MEPKKILRHYWKSILVVACILYLSFAPPSTFKRIPTFEHEDKLVHLLMYFGLTAMLIYEYYRNSKKPNSHTLTFVFICLVFPALFGGIIEVLQPLFFARSASWVDWIADLAGVLLAWLLMKLILKRIIIPKI